MIPDHIMNIIMDHFRGDISAEQGDTLHQWLDENMDDQELMEKFSTIWNASGIKEMTKPPPTPPKEGRP